jgi:hypothetical protein
VPRLRAARRSLPRDIGPTPPRHIHIRINRIMQMPCLGSLRWTAGLPTTRPPHILFQTTSTLTRHRRFDETDVAKYEVQNAHRLQIRFFKYPVYPTNHSLGRTVRVSSTERQPVMRKVRQSVEWAVCSSLGHYFPFGVFYMPCQYPLESVLKLTNVGMRQDCRVQVFPRARRRSCPVPTLRNRLLSTARFDLLCVR